MNIRYSNWRTLGVVLLLLALAVGGIAYFAFRRDMNNARARVAVGSEIAVTKCGPIEYAVRGRGPVVMIVHGAGGGFDQGLDFADPLAQRGFQVIAMSRFGYLRTPLPPDASAEAQANAHACLLDALHIERAAIVGASAGAPSSLLFALQHPERTAALVLLVPAAYVPRPDGGPALRMPKGEAFLFNTALRSDFLFWVAGRIAHRTLVRAILATPPEIVDQAEPAEQQRISQALRHVLPLSARRLGLQNDAAVTSTLPRYELERIKAPTLAISVADDLFGTYDIARFTAQHIPHARFAGYPTGGHLWVGRQRDVLDQITAFLRQEAAP